jgi:hypothetical protein
MLRGGPIFPRLPRRAPKLLLGIARRVAAWMRRVGKGARRPFCQPPVKALERRIQAAVGWAFFWLLFFAQTKKSNSPVGAKTDI